jgi:hypothetical protein
VCESYRCSVGQLAYVCFSIDIHFKDSHTLAKMTSYLHICLKFAYLHSGVRCAHHSGVIDSAVHRIVFAEKIDFVITAESKTPLCMSQRCQWLRWFYFKICIAAQRSHWLRCDKIRRLQSRFSRRILIHIEKGFNPCLRALGGVVWWKKQRSKISCQGPFKNALG